MGVVLSYISRSFPLVQGGVRRPWRIFCNSSAHKSHRKFKHVLVRRCIVVHQQIISTSTRGSKEALENPPIKQPTLRHLPDERFYHRWSVIVLPVHKILIGEDFQGIYPNPKPRSLWPKGTWSSWMGGLNSSPTFQWKVYQALIQSHRQIQNRLRINCNTSMNQNQYLPGSQFMARLQIKGHRNFMLAFWFHLSQYSPRSTVRYQQIGKLTIFWSETNREFPIVPQTKFASTAETRDRSTFHLHTQYSLGNICIWFFKHSLRNIFIFTLNILLEIFAFNFLECSFLWYHSIYNMFFFCKGGYEFTFVFDLSSECGWLWIYICIWFGFRMWLVVNLWTNLTSCFQMGSVRIFLRHKMPETNKDCDSSSSHYFILYSEKISDQRRRNKPYSSLFPISKC